MSLVPLNRTNQIVSAGLVCFSSRSCDRYIHVSSVYFRFFRFDGENMTQCLLPSAIDNSSPGTTDRPDPTEYPHSTRGVPEFDTHHQLETHVLLSAPRASKVHVLVT